eukprot:3510015-Pleurochrysis_carterae.AAC.2
MSSHGLERAYAARHKQNRAWFQGVEQGGCALFRCVRTDAPASIATLASGPPPPSKAILAAPPPAPNPPPPVCIQNARSRSDLALASAPTARVRVLAWYSQRPPHRGRPS